MGRECVVAVVLAVALAVAAALCPNNCGDHGACKPHASHDPALAQCVCDVGWEGEACDQRKHAALTRLYKCVDDCNWRGQCDNGTCVCDHQWTGPSCADPACDVDCHYPNGVCYEGACVCDDNHEGADCAVTKAECNPHCFHGQCVNGVCKCDVFHTGPRCETLRCPRDCSAHGFCDKGTCTCQTGWMGADCSTPAPPCPRACRQPHGQCRADGTCECAYGHTGDDCSLMDCTNRCSVHGVCANHSCVCDVGYEGLFCERRPLPPPAKGTEIWGAIDCDDGRAPPDCIEAVCAGNCSGVGTCTHGLCSCPSPYSGTYCQVRELENGKVVNGITVCNDGWSGEGCDQHLCHSHCKHGQCNSEGDCVCAEGFKGVACDMIACPNDCSGFGECRYGGLCECDSEHYGADCAQLRCPNECSGHGLCDNGVCVCADTWGGRQCDERRCGVDGLCSSHGVCAVGVCYCHDGWAGDVCQHFVLPSHHGLLLRLDSVWLVSCDEGWMGLNNTAMTSTTDARVDQCCTNKLVSCNDRADSLDDLDDHGVAILCPLGCAYDEREVFGSQTLGSYHPASALCLAAMHAALVVDDPPFPAPTGFFWTRAFKAPHQPTHLGALVNNRQSQDHVSTDTTWSLSFSPLAATLLLCSSTVANTPQLIAQLAGASVVTVACPAGCGQEPGDVFGDATYASDSVICKAAIHAGVLADGASGEVNITQVNGLQEYASTLGHGAVQSLFRLRTASAFEFAVLSNADVDSAFLTCANIPEIALTCEDTAQSAKLEHVPFNCTVSVVCPSGCYEGGDVWGTDEYVDASHICEAFVHSGVLTNAGGLGQLTVMHGEGETFWSHSKNGLKSRSQSLEAVERGFIPAPPTGFKECEGACSGHGLCNRVLGVCECDAGWMGDKCDMFPLPPPAHGHLLATDRVEDSVVCDAGYRLPDCVVRECPEGCDGVRGSCDQERGVCMCEDGWSGEDCQTEVIDPNDCSYFPDLPQCQRMGPLPDVEESAAPVACECNGHGTCDATGACVCFEGWLGKHCTQDAQRKVCDGSQNTVETVVEPIVIPQCVPNDCYGRGVCEIKDEKTAECNCAPLYNQTTNCKYETCDLCGVNMKKCIQTDTPPTIECECNWPYYGRYCRKAGKLEAKWDFPLVGGISPRGLSKGAVVSRDETFKVHSQNVTITAYYFFGGMSGEIKHGPTMDVWRLTLSDVGEDKAGFTFVTAGDREPNYQVRAKAPPTDRPVAREDHTAVRVGDSVVLFGGRAFVDSFHRFDATFRKLVPYPVSRDAQYFNDVWKFSLASGAWAKKPSLATRPYLHRARHTSVVVGAKMVVFGGLNDAMRSLAKVAEIGPSKDRQVFDDVWEFDTDSSSWSEGSPAPCGRYGHASTVFRSQMLVWGGRGSDSCSEDMLRQLWIYADSSWTTVDIENYPGKGLRTGHVLATSLNGHIVLWGGANDEEALVAVDMWVLEPDTLFDPKEPKTMEDPLAVSSGKSWTSVQAEPAGGLLPPPRDQALSVMHHTPTRSALLMYGGNSPQSVVRKDLWTVDIKFTSDNPKKETAPVEAGAEGGGMDDDINAENYADAQERELSLAQTYQRSIARNFVPALQRLQRESLRDLDLTAVRNVVNAAALSSPPSPVIGGATPALLQNFANAETSETQGPGNEGAAQGEGRAVPGGGGSLCVAPGRSQSCPAFSCLHALLANVTNSRVWVRHGDRVELVGCERTIAGGGWTLVFDNSHTNEVAHNFTLSRDLPAVEALVWVAASARSGRIETPHIVPLTPHVGEAVSISQILEQAWQCPGPGNCHREFGQHGAGTKRLVLSDPLVSRDPNNNNKCGDIARQREFHGTPDGALLLVDKHATFGANGTRAACSYTRHVPQGLVVRRLFVREKVHATPNHTPSRLLQGLGSSVLNPAHSCADVLRYGAGTADDAYWLSLPHAHSPQQVECLMSVEEGGWTLAFDDTQGSDVKQESGLVQHVRMHQLLAVTHADMENNNHGTVYDAATHPARTTLELIQQRAWFGDEGFAPAFGGITHAGLTEGRRMVDGRYHWTFKWVSKVHSPHGPSTTTSHASFPHALVLFDDGAVDHSPLAACLPAPNCTAADGAFAQTCAQQTPHGVLLALVSGLEQDLKGTCSYDAPWAGNAVQQLWVR